MSAPLPLTHDGRTFYVHELTQAMRNKFSAWMKADALRETLALRSQLPADVFRDLMSSLRDDISVRKLYEFGGEHYQDIVATPTGACEFARIVFNDPTLTDEEIEAFMTAKGEEFKEAFTVLNTPPAGTPEGKV